MDGPPELDGAEPLGRTVASRTLAKRVRKTGDVPPNVFLENRSARSISVDRMDRAPLRVLVELAVSRAQGRTPPKDFQGWAVVSAEQAASEGRTVRATPLPDNPHHADIFLNIPDGIPDIERRRRQKLHAQRLAIHATWREAP